jgi:hypothetical protein
MIEKRYLRALDFTSMWIRIFTVHHEDHRPAAERFNG